jgi:hypothetical protein
MPLRVYHVLVDRLGMDDAWAISGIHRRADRSRVASRLFDDGHYSHVAVIDRDDPTVANCQLAYALTQNVDRDWSRKPAPGVTPVEPSTEIDPGFVRGPQGHRSSMIGDVLVFGRFDGDRFVPLRRFVVDVEGFAEMPAQENEG